MPKNSAKNTLEKLRAKSHEAELNAHEKECLFAEIENFMEHHPLPSSPQRAPFYTVMNLFVRYTSAYAALLIIMTGSALAYVSESSDPNDLLYGVKRHFNERLLIGSASVSPHLRARAEQLLIERRLEEAESMLIDRSFAYEDSLILQAEIKKRSDSLQSYLARTEETDEDANQAFAMGSKLQDLLETHRTVLTELSTNTNDTSAAFNDEKEALAALTATLQDEASETGDIREQLAEKMPEYQQIIAEEYANTLITELSVLNERLATISQSSEPRTEVSQDPALVSILSTVTAAQKSSVRGNQYLDSKNYEGAIDSLQIALRKVNDANEKINRLETDRATATEVSTATSTPFHEEVTQVE